MGIMGKTAGGRTKQRKPKPEELLSSVIRETAPGAALEMLRANTPFILPSGTAYLVLLVAADSMGGLSKRQARDEDKGQLIEMIAADRIHTIADADMLEQDVFGVIPDEESLETLSEFSIITDQAELGWAIAYQRAGTDAIIMDQMGSATFAQARGVLAGTVPLETAVGEKGWAEHSGIVPLSDQVFASGASAPSPEPPTDQMPAIQDDPGDELFESMGYVSPSPQAEVDDEPEFSDEVEFVAEDQVDEFVEEPYAAPSPAVSATSPIEAEPAFDVETDYDEGYDQGDYDGDYAEDDGETLLVDEAEVEAVLARRFASDDLDLQVRLDEFEATFNIGAPSVQIVVPEGSTAWLGDQIAHLTRQANAELAQTHATHEDALRTLYVTYMSRMAEQIMREVSVEREGSRYKAMSDDLDDGVRARRENKDEEIRDRKQKIREDYEAQAEEVGTQAALQAKLQFKERNRTRMEREQAEVAVEVDRVIEDEFTRATQAIFRVRKRDAQLKFQVGQTKIVTAIAERRDELMEKEAALLGKWQDRIQELIEDNRVADKIHIETLQEHQRTSTVIDDLRKEQEAALAALRAEHTDRVRQLEASLGRAEAEASEKLRLREEELTRHLEIERTINESKDERITGLVKQAAEAETAADQRNANRIEQLESDREAMGYDIDRLERGRNLMMLAFAGMSVVFAGVGGVAGMVLGVAIG